MYKWYITFILFCFKNTGNFIVPFFYVTSNSIVFIHFVTYSNILVTILVTMTWASGVSLFNWSWVRSSPMFVYWPWSSLCSITATELCIRFLRGGTPSLGWFSWYSCTAQSVTQLGHSAFSGKKQGYPGCQASTGLRPFHCQIWRTFQRILPNLFSLMWLNCLSVVVVPSS